MPGAQMLRWGQQVAAAAAAGPVSSSNGHSAAAESGPASHNTPEEPSAASADGAPLSADPFAFDMGAFGSGGAAAMADDVNTAQQAPEPVSAAAPDPFAFRMSAFSGLGVDQQSAAQASEPVNSTSAAAADPFAFDMNSFGGGAAPHADDTGRAGSDPYAADRSGAEEAAQQALAPAQQADPFAFDTSAFGGSSPPAAPASSAPAGMQASNGSTSRQSMAEPDPFAFSMSSFGGLPQQVPAGADPDDDRGQDPFAADRPKAAEPDQAQPAAQPDIMSGMLDLSAFGMGHHVGATGSEGALAPAAPAAVPRPGTPESSEPARQGSSSRAAQPPQLGPNAGTASSRSATAGAGRPDQSSSSARQSAFDPPAAEPFAPLTAAELAELEQRLRSAAGLLPEPDAAGKPTSISSYQAPSHAARMDLLDDVVLYEVQMRTPWRSRTAARPRQGSSWRWTGGAARASAWGWPGWMLPPSKRSWGWPGCCPALSLTRQRRTGWMSRACGC